MSRICAVALACATLLVAPAAAAAGGDERTLQRYAKGTWQSFVAMTDERTGLPTDLLHGDGSRDIQTSTTNIGAYMWSAVAAEKLGIIGRRELLARMARTISTVEVMETYAETGQFYNWYDHRTGEKLTTNNDGTPRVPILSSVDNAWLAVGLKIVAERVPQLRARARAIYDAMDFGFYYRPEVNRILFHYAPDTGAEPCCYDTIVSESRIAYYVGVAKGDLPSKVFYGPVRTFPETCAGSFQEMRPEGFTRIYEGQTVYEGTYPTATGRLVPSWGGSMFEALMPPLFVPEEEWGPASWRVNHPNTVDAQIDHGINVAGYGAWGFSPSADTLGGYGIFGVDAAGMDAGGNASNLDRTLVDRGWDDPACPRPALLDPPQRAYTNGIVTPHAAFLGLRWRPREALASLAKLERDFDAFTKWGFYDAVNVTPTEDKPTNSDSFLSLDQGMIMAALGNALGRDVLRDAFATRDVERATRPAVAVEEFNVQPRGCTITGTEGADRLHGTRRDDVICGLGGNDAIRGGGGDDVVYGDAGDDRLAGDWGDDALYGDDGADRLAGDWGDDVLAGGPGADVMTGGAGRDHAEQGG
jgi:hypothetical protein